MTWGQVSFSDIVQARGSGSSGLPQSEWSDEGQFPVIGQGAAFVEGWTDREDLVLRPNPAVVLYGGHTRRAKFVDRPFVPGPNVRILEPAKELDAKFLFHYLSQLPIESRGYADHFPEVRRYSVPLPSLSEQRHIAAILDKADALRAKRREAIAKLDQLLQSVFLDMFGDPESNPKRWPLRSLEELKDPKDRINYGVVQPGAEFPGGVPVVRVGDIEGGKLDKTSIKRIDPEIEASYPRSRLKGNELLVSCVGSIGTVAAVPSSAIGFNIARAMTRVPLADASKRVFVQQCLRTPALQRYFSEKTRTVSQPTLNVEFVKSAMVFDPPVAMVDAYCNIAAKVEAACQQQRASARTIEDCFASLQQRAFQGTL